MTKSSRLLLGAVLTLALTLPALVWGQAVPRGSGSSGGGSGSSSGGSSSGGGSGSSSSSDSGGGSGPTYSPPPMRTPPPARTAPEGSRTGTAVRRGSPSSGSPASAGAGSASSGVAGDPSGRSNPNRDVDPRSRDRNGRPISGVAVPRQPGDYSSLQLYSWYRSGYPWYSSGYPYYGSGLGWYYGYGYPAYSPFITYNPLFYSRWMWGRYGLWYDPFDPFGYYDPFYLDPYYGGYGGYGGYSYGGSSSVSEASPREATGSVRVRVKPARAKVYLDGTLVGIVDEFDGLTSHLAATTGTHEIEVRADGFEPLKLVVNVEEDRTVTARGSLKRK